MINPKVGLPQSHSQRSALAQEPIHFLMLVMMLQQDFGSGVGIGAAGLPLTSCSSVCSRLALSQNVAS